MSKEVAQTLERILGLMDHGPRALKAAVSAAEIMDNRRWPLDQAEVAETIRTEGWAGPVHAILKTRLTKWDYQAEGDWIDGTPPNTSERRGLIYRELGLTDDLAGALTEWLPHYEAPKLIKVVDAPPTGWYDEARRAERDFYWSHYVEQLRAKDWPEESINDLDESTHAVMERLADPTAPEAYPKKGMVVGYVQSGKTANITGVIAKAADAGYRLVIILSGQTKLLRAQTQRRIDSELMGKELIRPEGVPDEDTDYLDDADWDEGFVSYGDLPSRLGSFDWARLTGYKEDYRRIRTGLEFEQRDPNRPLFDPENLHAARARIMVVKKNGPVLKRVAADLARIRPSADQVPALIIDDESDQASVNTAKRPTPSERKKRSAINQRIVDILKALPRAQYIGYTATPFANVFIDVRDAEDLFPSDFLIGLKRPLNYMGASDFHDLDPLPPGADEDPAQSNEMAFVRDVRGADAEPNNLLAAIDAYVLSGAIKLFRERRGEARFRHHTMLVHSSQNTNAHEAMRDEVVATLSHAGYDGGAGQARLKKMLDEDFSVVSRARPGRSPLDEEVLLSIPSFDELREDIGEMLSRLRDDRAVLIVNGTEKSDDPDFDKQRVWKILVGGAKLSRGYTVEGLTVSYFRRRTGTADTLMQMGRWFGFRRGYRDLVRVYIGREERHGKKVVDLYEAFEGVCRDEEEFRAQLARYAMPEDGSPPLTPKQVAPLVHSHLPWLPPVASNKRYNAVIREMDFRGKWSETTVAPEESEKKKLERNADRFSALLASMDLRAGTLSADRLSAKAIWGLAPVAEILNVFRSYEWAGDLRPVQHQIEYLSGAGEIKATIDDWLLIAPQLERAPRPGWTWSAAGHDFHVKYRSRIGGGRIKAYSEPTHRKLAEVVTGKDTSLRPAATLAELVRPSRGVLLFYPVWTEDSLPKPFYPVMGFAALFPGTSAGTRIIWQIHDPANPGAAVVTA